MTLPNVIIKTLIPLFTLLILVRSQNELPWILSSVVNVEYGLGNYSTCIDAACGPLNAISGISPIPDPAYSGGPDQSPRDFALLGALNGLDVVEVTNNLQGRHNYIKRCYSETRTIATWFNNYKDETMYAINDYSPHCDCNPDETLCGLEILYYLDDVTPHTFRVTENTKFSLPLNITGDVVGPLVFVNTSCTEVPQDLTGAIALIERKDECTLGFQWDLMQKANAAAVILINNRDDLIFPPTPRNFPATIPGVLISQPNGKELKDLLFYIRNVTLSNILRVPDTQYSPPQGLSIIDLSHLRDDRSAYLNASLTTWFNYARRLFTETVPNNNFPYLLVGGTDSYNGGVLILNISNPTQPTWAGSWQDNFASDIFSKECIVSGERKRILFVATAPTQTIAVVDITDVTQPTTLATFSANGIPHRIWPSYQDSCDVLFVSYEGNQSVALFGLYWAESIIATPAGGLVLGSEPISLDIEVYGDKLFVAGPKHGITVLDIASPFNSRVVGEFNSTDLAFRKDLFEFYLKGVHKIYTANRDKGLFLIDILAKSSQIVQQDAKQTPLQTSTYIFNLVFGIALFGIALVFLIITNRSNARTRTFIS